MIKFSKLNKLSTGDKVAIISPSFAAPGRWPHVHALGLTRLREVFQLVPVEYPSTSNLQATLKDRQCDLEAAFRDPSIKAVIATIGGDHQIAYVKHMAPEIFSENPKPFFGYSDNTHLANMLWLHGIPSYYGGCLFTEFAMQGEMDPFTVHYLRSALFSNERVEFKPSEYFKDVGLNWDDPSNLLLQRSCEVNEGWFWSVGTSPKSQGVLWGGAVESVDELLRHRIAIPALEAFGDIILALETSEELPSAAYVSRVFRALGELRILERVQGILIGRPKAWSYETPVPAEARVDYRKSQRETIEFCVRQYNKRVPIVQNLDFGHTAPQICLPFGQRTFIDSSAKTIFAEF